MAILRSPRVTILLGGLAILLLAMVSAGVTGRTISDRLEEKAMHAIVEAGGAPVVAHFHAHDGTPTRHPLLTGGEGLNEAVRDRVARAVGSISGVGGVRWSDGTALAESAAETIQPLHCQEDVEALLRARTIRFEESSARIDAASRELIDEVAAALRPCLGSIIAITGHTDSSGP